MLITVVSLLARMSRAHAAGRVDDRARPAVVATANDDVSSGDFDAADRELVVGDVTASGALTASTGRDEGLAAVAGFEPGWSDDLACACDAADFARAAASAPALPDVIAAAQRAAGLGDDPVPSWRTRSRWSALVPTLSARIGTSQSWRDVTDPTVTPPVSRATSWDVRASWRLDSLVYDANAPRFAAFDIQRRRERRRIAAAVTHEYFAWLSARATQIGAATNPDRNVGSASGTARSLMQAQRARAELDALTDGWFSARARVVSP